MFKGRLIKDDDEKPLLYFEDPEKFRLPLEVFSRYETVRTILGILHDNLEGFVDIDKAEEKGLGYVKKNVHDQAIKLWTMRYLTLMQLKHWHLGVKIRFTDYIKWLRDTGSKDTIIYHHSQDFFEEYTKEVSRRDLRELLSKK